MVAGARFEPYLDVGWASPGSRSTASHRYAVVSPVLRAAKLAPRASHDDPENVIAHARPIVAGCKSRIPARMRTRHLKRQRGASCRLSVVQEISWLIVVRS